MTAGSAKAAKSTDKPTTEKPADRPTGDQADPNRCVVSGCTQRQVPGSKVCSAHTMHYHLDGSRRDGKVRDV